MKTRHAVMMMTLMISLVTVLLFAAGFAPKGALPNDKVSSAAQGKQAAELDQADLQLQQLLELARGQAAGRLDAVVKWQGSWNTGLQVKEAAGQLAERLGLPAPQAENVQGHQVYAAEGLKDAIMGKLSLMEVDGALYVIYRLEAEAENAQELVRQQHSSGTVLLQNGVEAKWNASVQGLAPAGAEAAQTAQTASDSSGAPSLKEASLMLTKMEKGAGTLQAEPIDSFEDGTTVSRTYEIPSFGITTLINGRSAGLQMASHTDTVTGLQEVSWGSPMLTIEY